MGMKEISAGTVIYETEQKIDTLYLVVKGLIKASFPGGEYFLKNGDIVGLADLSSKDTLLKYEAIEKTSVVTYEFDGSVSDFLGKNKDVTKYFLASLFSQLESISGQYLLVKNEYQCLKDYLITCNEDYKMFCDKISLSPSELENYDEVTQFSFEDVLPEWVTGYYAILQEIVKQSELGNTNCDFITGLMVKSSRDIREMISLSGEIESYEADILNLLMNENSLDMFEMYVSLYTKAVKKLGMDDRAIGQIYRAMEDILMQAETRGISEESFFDRRKSEYKKVLENAEQIAQNHKENEEIYGSNQTESLNDSLNTILNYAEPDEEIKKAFYEHVTEYKKTVNKNGTEDDVRLLRQRLAKEFNEVYIAAFLKAAKDSDVPAVLKMFFNFGYVDEELVGMENAVYLYNLISKLPTDPENGIYSMFEWLLDIYNGKKDPCRNEFETDYADYLHEEMRNKRISKEEEASLFKDPEGRVRYELENVFPTVNKTTTGRISTFCPLLSEHNALKPFENMLVTASNVSECINMIRNIDFGAFYRETVFADPVINKEYIDIEIIPDIILTPNIGSRGIMWQEIEGKRRTTPAKMFCSIFQQEDLQTQLLRLTGQFRWEMCKRVQGARWNDVSERSLTSEYFDYVQYYRKNNELSPEAKEKIKNDMTRCKNSFREMFIRDYIVWMQFESNGSPRLNKVARGIMFTYVPFSKASRDKLSINPMYKDMIEHYDTKQKAKIHRMDNLVKKIKNAGKEVPEEIEAQIEFLNA